jgi:uncharacterized protein YdiU (UPF0061 family)
MKLSWKTENTYKDLPSVLFSLVDADPIDKPRLVVFNHALADALGLTITLSDEELAQLCSGNLVDERWRPLAQAYAGHQFGGFGILGDGRALLLTEILDAQGQRFDLQLKGSGRTPYSRGGDGKAALGPMLREYLISEAMHALGIPTTRSLAVVQTNEKILREKPLPGAILARIAQSHIRVGTFQWITQTGDSELQRQFFHYTLQRHFPHLIATDNAAEHLLLEVIQRQATLVALWQSVGFVHGVMNTDNMVISGETIDYGPCAFLDQYHADAVFSSIDHQGRYAYKNQPNAALWNLTRFAETLLSLLDDNNDMATKKAEAALATFAPLYVTEYYRLMGRKIGIEDLQPEDHPLVDRLLGLMQTHQADYTNTFVALGRKETSESWFSSEDGSEWNSLWIQRISKEHDPYALMNRVNPQVIPRNHLVDEALTIAQQGDMTLFHELLEQLQHPFQDTPKKWQTPGDPTQRFVTYCGT